MFRNILVTLIGFALIIGCTPKIDQKKFENLHHAAKAIQAATAVGVTNLKFVELLQGLATEISVAKDIAKSDLEKELLKGYSDILVTYHESATVWNHKIKSLRYNWIPSGQIFVEEELRPIIFKYTLRTEQHIMKYSKQKYDIISEDSIQVIWGKANDQIEKITKLYLGQEI